MPPTSPALNTRTVAQLPRAIRNVLDGAAQPRTLDPALYIESCTAELTTLFATATATRINT